MKKWILDTINSLLSRLYLKEENIHTFQDLEYRSQVPPCDLNSINSK